ncbi:MAG: sensor histidine kinase, partial [Pyrinomonadaceae bacterium]
PLNAVKMGSDLLLASDGLPPAQRSVVSSISRSAARMERMIGDLLDFTRLRFGQGLPVTPEETDLLALSQTAVEELEMAHPGRRIEVRGAGDCRAAADPDRAAQVVSNLVANALQYSLRGTPVLVNVNGEGAEAVRLEVHNEGEPIPPVLLPELFEPFRRNAGEDKPRLATSGLGLGLYIVKQIMLAHGGTIEARSTREGGTIFAARWPRRAAALAAPAQAGRG